MRGLFMMLAVLASLGMAGCGPLPRIDEGSLAQRANQGEAVAQNQLGRAYAEGRGGTQDDRLAVEWFLKAAEQGNAKAQYNLGVMYHDGRGVLRDDRQAVEWFQRAADQNYVPALDNLEVLQGTPPRRSQIERMFSRKRFRHELW